MLTIIICIGCQSPSKHATSRSIELFQKADTLLKYGSLDSAYYYFKETATSTKDDSLAAIAYNRMGRMLFDIGDYLGSQEDLTHSLDHLDTLDTKDSSTLASDYQMLSNDNLELKNYAEARKYCEKALRFLSNEAWRPILLNTKATIYQKQGLFDSAQQIYESILNKSQQDTVQFSRVLSNLARNKWLQNPDYDAAPELKTALSMRRQQHNLWGLNASYSHLSDYYSKSNKDSAFIYAMKMYDVAKTLNSGEDQVAALEKLTSLSNPLESQTYFSKYIHLKDSINLGKLSSKNQFASIRYDSDRSQAQNLELQKKNNKQRMMIAWIVIAFVFLTVIAIIWAQKRRQRIKQEAETAIRDNQIRTSKKVHDVVANELYRIMSELEHKDDIPRDLLLDDIERLYEQSREISYEPAVYHATDFSEQLNTMVRSFATSSRRILITGNSTKIWDKTLPATKTEISYVLRELMVNMAKHSQAKNVVVRFLQDNQNLVIKYSDDGVGLSPSHQNGNGMRNTGTRIKSIGADIIFGQDNDKGLAITITIPLTGAT